MCGWVRASTSGLMRSDTDATRPIDAATASRRSSSGSLSALKQRIPAASPARISASDLPTPEKITRAAAPPAASTRASSPPETMSKPAPARARASSTATLSPRVRAEAECHRAVGAVLARVEALAEAEDGLDVGLEAGILTIPAPDESRIIVNRQTPNQEIWVAARSGGFHFAFRDGRWLDTRSGDELFASLARAIGSQAGIHVDRKWRRRPPKAPQRRCRRPRPPAVLRGCR